MMSFLQCSQPPLPAAAWQRRDVPKRGRNRPSAPRHAGTSSQLLGFVRRIRPTRRLRPSKAFGTLVVLASWLLAPPSHAQPAGAAPKHDVELWLSGEAQGRLFEPRCDDETHWEAAEPARALGAVPTDFPRPLLLGAGGLLAPHALTREVAERTPDALAEAVAKAGFGALLLDVHLLGTPSAVRDPLLAALHAQGIAILASNLVCEAAHPLCDAVTDARDGLPTRRTPSGARVALVGLLPPSMMKKLPASQRDGLKLHDPAEVLARSVRRARRRHLDVVIALLAADPEDDPMGAARALLAALPEDGRPDVLVVGAAGGQWLFARPPTVRPALVAPPAAGLLRLNIQPAPGGDLNVMARPVPSATRAPAPLQALADRFGPDYCQRWARPLDVPLPEGVEEAGALALLDRAADVAREAAGAEVALLPTRLVEPNWKPLREDMLSASDLMVGLREDPQLRVATVEGAWLDGLAKKGLSWLHARGLEAGDKTKVAGRTVDPNGRYTVVASLDVADRLVTEGLTADWRPLGETGLREMTLTRLAERPDEPLWDPAQEPEWTLRADLQGSFAGTSVSNPGGAYDDSQVQRDETVSFGMRLDVRGGAEAPDWGWQGELSPRYQVVRTATSGQEEADDLVPLRLSGRYRGLQPEEPRWYVPEPSAEVFLETEFTIPEERAWRHMLFRPTLGLQWGLTKHLSARLSAGAEGELLDPDDTLAPGVGLHLELAPWSVLSEAGRKLELSAQLDTFTREPFASTQRHTVRGELKATFDLLGPLSLGWNLSMYAVQAGDLDWGLQATGQVLLQVGWQTRSVSH